MVNNYYPYNAMQKIAKNYDTSPWKLNYDTASTQKLVT